MFEYVPGIADHGNVLLLVLPLSVLGGPEHEVYIKKMTEKALKKHLIGYNLKKSRGPSAVGGKEKIA